MSGRGGKRESVRNGTIKSLHDFHCKNHSREWCTIFLNRQNSLRFCFTVIPTTFSLASPSSQNAPSFHFHFLDNVLLLIKTGIGDLSQRLLHSRGRSRRDWFPVPAMHASAAERLSLLRPPSASPKPQHTPTQSCTNATRLRKIHKNPR